MFQPLICSGAEMSEVPELYKVAMDWAETASVASTALLTSLQLS